MGNRRVPAAPKNADPERIWMGWMGCAGSRHDGSTAVQSAARHHAMMALTGVRSVASVLLSFEGAVAYSVWPFSHDGRAGSIRLCLRLRADVQAARPLRNQ